MDTHQIFLRIQKALERCPFYRLHLHMFKNAYIIKDVDEGFFIYFLSVLVLKIVLGQTSAHLEVKSKFFNFPDTSAWTKLPYNEESIKRILLYTPCAFEQCLKNCAQNRFGSFANIKKYHRLFSKKGAKNPVFDFLFGEKEDLDNWKS